MIFYKLHGVWGKGVGKDLSLLAQPIFFSSTAILYEHSFSMIRVCTVFLKFFINEIIDNTNN